MPMQPANTRNSTRPQACLAIPASRRGAPHRHRHELTTPEDMLRDPLPPGHPASWGLITNGTLLEGAPYIVMRERL